MQCNQCGSADITINTFEESKAGCGGLLNWIMLIVIGIIAASTGFIIVVIGVGIISVIVIAITRGIPGLLGITKKTKTLCICKGCGNKWEI
mgnify:CR=1 FL=1